MTSGHNDIAIIGGGVAGLSLALNLHRRGVACRVYERAPEVKELGVGITLLPHAMREFTALGVDQALFAAGLETRESAFFNRFGQLIYKERRGLLAGYAFQSGSLVYGVEGDIASNSLNKKFAPQPGIVGNEIESVFELHGRARLGYDMGNYLPFIAGGVAVDRLYQHQTYPNDFAGAKTINALGGPVPAHDRPIQLDSVNRVIARFHDRRQVSRHAFSVRPCAARLGRFDFAFHRRH